MKNNKGISLIELIVVIAIIGIVTGMAAMSLNSLLGFDVKESVNDLSSEISRARVISLSHGPRELKIYKDAGDGCYYVTFYSTVLGEDSVLAEKISAKNMKITYFTDKMAATGTEITDTNVLRLSFDKSSGAFKPLNADLDYCQKITVSKGSRQAVILLYPETGKHYIQ